MRTKNLNLKKKIAFIASVAMIATTASYLPVGTFTASADNIYNSASDLYAENTSEFDDDATTQTNNNNVAEQIDTVDIFVKINGKYLSVKPGVTPEYKLTNTPDLTGATDYQPVLANDVIARMDAATAPANSLLIAGTDPFGAKRPNANGTAMVALDGTKPETYDVIELDPDKAKLNAIELPYIADASEVEFEFAAKKKAKLGKNSVTSISVNLNKYGIAKVAKQSEYVIGKSDSSNFDEDKKEFKANTQKGVYEIIDLSGLVVCMRNTGNENEAISTANVKIEETKEGTNSINTHNGAVFDFVAGENTILEDKDIDAVTYDVKKVGNVYAKVIKTKLATAAAANAVFKINTGVNGNWTASGKNVSKGVVTVSMDATKDGFASSELVTMTQGSKKEYYVYVVENADNALTNKFTGNQGAKAQGNVDFKGDLSFSTFCGEAANTNPNNTAIKVQTETFANNDFSNVDFAQAANKNYKVVREITTEKIKNKDTFVTKYIVYNNAKSDNFDNNKTVTLTLDNAGQNYELAFADDTIQTANSGYTTLSNVGPVANATYNTVTLTLSSAGTGETAPLAYVYGNGTKEFFVVEFTNDYEIEYDEQWEDNREDNTKSYDGKVSVTGQSVSNPGAVSRPGFEFQGWSKTAAAGSTDYVYSTNNGSEQIEAEAVTPNTKLYAQYKGLRYNVELDANGGYITNGKKAGGALSTYAYYPGLSAKEATVDSFAQVERDINDVDIKSGNTAIGGNAVVGWKTAEATKVGYKFKGWSTKKDATEGMTVEQLAAAFPGENKSLTLYAVWEANEVTANFKYLPFNSNGTVETMDGKFEGTNGVGKAWYDAAANTAEFEKAADGYVTFTTGDKLGELPTPYLAGYEFEGWYAAVFNDNLTSVSATKVTADTVLDATLFADAENNHFGTVNNNVYNSGTTHGASTDGTQVYLYAKFTPKTYTITFDIGDGLWGTTKFNDDEEGQIPATVSYNKNTQKYTYKRADGSTISDGTVQNVPVGEWGNLGTAYNPKYGDDRYTGFKNWTINGGKKTYADLNAVKKAIEDMDKLEDIVVKANYEAKSQANASIFLNANEGAIYTYKVQDKDTTTKKPTKYYTTNDYDAYTEADAQVSNAWVVGQNGVVEKDVTVLGQAATIKLDTVHKLFEATKNAEMAVLVDSETPDKFGKTGQAFAPAAAGTKVSDTYKVDGAYVEPVTGSGDGWVVARPGYTFTGWYTDKECTQKYTFNVYPERGTQTILFAGWKANTTVRYYLAYDLFNGDKSEASDQSTYLNRYILNNQPVVVNGDTNMKYIRTFMGTAGDKINAKDLVINVKDGTGTQSTYNKYVFDANLSKDLDTTEKELKCTFSKAGLLDGKFEQDIATYTLIEGRYMEDGFQTPEEPPVSTELGNATGVKGTANGDKVTISFKAADNAVKYQVCKIVNGKKYYTSKTDATSIDITPASVDYEVYVIAFDKDGKSTHSETIKLTGVKKYDLGTVMDPVATEKLEADGTKTVTISWSKAENAAWYKVFKIVNGKKYWGKKVTETSYVLKNIPATDSYIVYVAAGDDKGHVTYGARKKVSKFPSVTNVTVAPDNKTVTFDAVEGATAYQVAKIETNNKVNYSAKSTNPSITLKNAFKAGQKYYVLAFFTDADGKTKSSYSDTFEIK